MNFEDDFRDLAPLDPARDPQRWERMVGGIMAAAGPELARRAALPQPGMLLLLSDWLRPTVSAAALMAAAAAAFLVAQGPATAPVAEAGLAESLGYPTAVADWVYGGDAPSVEALVTEMEGAGR
ncbi:MAG TPA: hypothetical protein VHG51_11680 [Longimicrobiaceae bacterium]|nr:hypothetical protein [Longimicrobiaceae bacterium]